MGSRIATLACALGLVALTAGCDPDPLWLECPMSESIINACEAEGETTSLTCVVEKHPFCLQEICASWEGQASVCTQRCTSDAQCPAESKCMEHLDIRFCVQDKYLGGGAAAPTGGADAGPTADTP